MLAIALNENELMQLKLLLRDIELIQKLNRVFDSNAIEILSYKVIEHLNNKKDFMPKIEILDDEIYKKADFVFQEYISDHMHDGFILGCQWYREQLKLKNKS